MKRREIEWGDERLAPCSLDNRGESLNVQTPFPQTANSVHSVRKMDNQTKTHKSYMPQIIILSICFFGIFFAFNTSQVRFVRSGVTFRPCRRL